MKENDNFDSKINNLEEKLKTFETKLKAEKQQQKDKQNINAITIGFVIIIY